MHIPDSISQIAAIVDKHWKNVTYHARPNIDAMYCLETMDDKFRSDSAPNVICCFLGNAQPWTGPVATAVKDKLNELIQQHRRKGASNPQSEQRQSPDARRIGLVDVFHTLPIGSGYTFGIDGDGWGRIFNYTGFVGIAHPKSVGPSTEFVVNIFGTLVPDGKFRRRTYASQKTANSALVRYAQKAIKSIGHDQTGRAGIRFSPQQ